jgi:hypothetical protein
MKRIFVVTLLVLLVVLALAVPAFAQEEHCASGEDFGLHHADMAQESMLSGEHNPGMHEGYSHCLP